MTRLSNSQEARHLVESPVSWYHLNGLEYSSSQIRAWMSGKGHKNHQALTMEQLGSFLDGFITYSRGPKDAPSVLCWRLRIYIDWAKAALRPWNLLVLVQDLIRRSRASKRKNKLLSWVPSDLSLVIRL